MRLKGRLRSFVEVQARRAILHKLAILSLARITYSPTWNFKSMVDLTFLREGSGQLEARDKYRPVRIIGWLVTRIPRVLRKGINDSRSLVRLLNQPNVN